MYQIGLLIPASITQLEEILIVYLIEHPSFHGWDNGMVRLDSVAAPYRSAEMPERDADLGVRATYCHLESRVELASPFTFTACGDGTKLPEFDLMGGRPPYRTCILATCYNCRATDYSRCLGGHCPAVAGLSCLAAAQRSW